MANLPQEPQGTLSASPAGSAGYNPAWYAATAIFIDPVAGSDAAAGTSSGAPIKTWAEAVRRWGTTSPLLTGNCTVTFLSSQADNTDPVVWTPMMFNGGVPAIVGTTPTPTAAVFTRSAQKNRTAGANALLAGSFSAGAPAAGVLVQNTTAGKSSRAFVYKTAGGANWNMTQPVALQTIPQNVVPAEVDTWASTDTVNLLAMVSVNVVRFSPMLGDFNGAFDNSGYLSQLVVLDPAGVGADNVYLGAVSCLDVFFQRSVCADEASIVPGVSTGITFDPVFSNCWFAGGLVWQSTLQPLVWAGAAPGTVGALIMCFTPTATAQFARATIDGDFISGTSGGVIGNAIIGFMYMDNGMVQPDMTGILYATAQAGGHALYGAGASVLQMQGRSRGVMGSGTWAAGWTAPTLVTGVTMNGGTTAQTHTNASPDVVTSGVATSVANADEASGGNMLVWGGASISKAA